jgi:outer membrane protein assembly factor BamB
MAKKKKSVVTRKKAALPEAPVKPVESVKKPNSMLLLILAAFVLLTAGEIYLMGVKSARESKKPVYVKSWPNHYHGLTSVGQYGGFIYGVDGERGVVYKTNKETGSLDKLLTYTEGVNTALENSKGEFYILMKTSEIFQVDPVTYKTIRKLRPGGMTDAYWMDVDSKDDILLISASTGKIAKFSKDFVKIKEFAGRGDDKGSLNAPGKIFVDSMDQVYALENKGPGALAVKVYDNDGKFLRSWNVTKVKKFDQLTSLAIANDGNVYINSFDEKKIYVFNAAGKYLGSFDTDKDRKFQIAYIPAMTGAKDGNIYVATHMFATFKPIVY